jgi:hypothetical protein
MKRIAGASLPLLFLAITACMNTPPPQDPENTEDDSTEKKKNNDNPTAEMGGKEDNNMLSSGSGAGGGSMGDKATIRDDTDKKAAPCSGKSITDLLAVISQTACEVPKATPEGESPVDVKDSLDIKATIDTARVPPGARANITVMFINKGAKDLPLDFVADPDPRFELQAYLPKGGRADKPAGPEPALPSSVSDQQPSERAITRVTLAAKGTAKLVLPWDAVKYKWASADRAKGALPGQHYPMEPAGPLAKGKYVVRVVMPLVGVNESADHELTQPRAQVEVGSL